MLMITMNIMVSIYPVWFFIYVHSSYECTYIALHIHIHVVHALATTSDVPKVSLKMILAFFTGADSIPPIGYNKVTMSFNGDNPYPTASTCGLELTLPTKYDEYGDFKRSLNVAFTMHGGFGLY